MKSWGGGRKSANFEKVLCLRRKKILADKLGYLIFKSPDTGISLKNPVSVGL